MGHKKIFLFIGILVVLLVWWIVFLVYRRNQVQNVEIIDEKTSLLETVEEKKQIKERWNKKNSEDFHENLTEIFEGEGYEQIQWEYWFTAEWF